MTESIPSPASKWLVLATTIGIIAAVEAAGAVLSGGRIVGAIASWPGVLLLSHAGWALRRGAIRARINRKESIGDPDDHRWAITIWNPDVLTRETTPGWFTVYVGAELTLGLLLTAATAVPLLERIQGL